MVFRKVPFLSAKIRWIANLLSTSSEAKAGGVSFFLTVPTRVNSAHLMMLESIFVPILTLMLGLASPAKVSPQIARFELPRLNQVALYSTKERLRATNPSTTGRMAAASSGKTLRAPPKGISQDATQLIAKKGKLS